MMDIGTSAAHIVRPTENQYFHLKEGFPHTYFEDANQGSLQGKVGGCSLGIEQSDLYRQ